MAEMWGIAGGLRNFAQDQLQLQKFALERQEAQNMALHREAQRIATNTELAQRERKLRMEEDREAEKKFVAELMATPGEGEDLTTPAGEIRAFRERGNRFLALGMVEDATKLSNTAAQILVRLQNAANAESQIAEREFQQQARQTSMLREMLTGVKSREDFDRAKLAIAAMPEMGDFLEHEMLKSYNPELIQRFVQNSPAWVKQRELELREQNQRSSKALRDARITYLGFQRDIQERQVKVNEDREARLAKAGATTAGGGEGGSGAGGGKAPTPAAAKLPSDKARLEVMNYLKEQKLLANDSGMRNLQVSLLTEDAMTLVQRNRQIASFGEAVQIAIANAQQRGELTQEDPFMGKPRGVFKQQLGSVSRPVNVTANSKIDYKEGQHYRDPAGNVVRYEGGRFVPVYSADVRRSPQPAMPPANNPLLNDDD